MNSIEEAKVRAYLQYELHYDPYECGTIIYCIRSLARMAGHDLDHRFAHTGLGAGPEARVASGILDLALGGGGCETAMYTIRTEIDRWLRTTGPKGMIA
ncbi:MAG: hypothetical protein ACYSUQ_07370 [Planctomycetota bacterium]|jgi:hypothetical protein